MIFLLFSQMIFSLALPNELQQFQNIFYVSGKKKSVQSNGKCLIKELHDIPVEPIELSTEPTDRE